MVCMMSGVLFQGWDNGTLGNTLSRCVTQDPRVDALEVVSHGQTLPGRGWPHKTTSEDSAIYSTQTMECGHMCPYIKLTFHLHYAR